MELGNFLPINWLLMIVLVVVDVSPLSSSSPSYVARSFQKNWATLKTGKATPGKKNFCLKEVWKFLFSQEQKKTDFDLKNLHPVVFIRTIDPELVEKKKFSLTEVRRRRNFHEWNPTGYLFHRNEWTFFSFSE